MDLYLYLIATLLVGAACGLLLARWGARRRRPGPRVRTATRPQCGSCVHFDLEEGQASIRHNPAFAEYARWIPPRTTGAPRVPVDPETGEPQADSPLLPNTIPERCEWVHFGACLRHEQLVWREQDVSKALDEGTECPDFEDRVQ